MKIKRYTGASTREVLGRIRQDLGADAVILSNREIVGGVELMAAVDFDASQLQPEAAHEPAPVREAAPVRAFVPAPVAPQPAAAAPRVAMPAPRGETVAVAARAVPPRTSLTAPQAPQPPQQPAPQWSGEISSLRAELDALRDWVRSSVPAAPGSEPVSQPLVMRLQALGLGAQCARDVARGGADLDSALRGWLESLPMHAEPMVRDGVYALVGATGSGKTTTIAKLAARLVLRHGTDAVALITTDTYRIGGVEQLKIYGRILGVPVAVARDAGELQGHLDDFAGRRFVLVDTIGLSPRDQRLEEQLAWLRGFGARITPLLLASAGMNLGFYAELWRLYGQLPIAAVILTKLDETPSFGAALQWLHEQALPLWFYTDGQRVPEDLQVASAAKIAALLQGEALAPRAQAPRQVTAEADAGSMPAVANSR